MPYFCECERELDDMYISPQGVLMVDCPEHGLHEWGEVESPEVAS